MLQVFKISAVIVLSMLISAPAPALADQEAVNEIMEQVKFFISDDNELEACRLVTKLDKYQETEAYEGAKTELLRYGISIEAPLDSYTAKRMVKLQNKLEKNRAVTGMMPKLGDRADYKDAWGTPVRVEFVSSKGYHYVIRSAGKDRQFFTSDDLVVGTRNLRDREERLGDTGSKKSSSADETKQTEETEETAGTSAAEKVQKNSRQVGRSSLMHGRRPDGTGGRSQMDALKTGNRSNAPAEREITLDELQETIGN